MRRIGFAPDSSQMLAVGSGSTVVFNPVLRRLTAQLAEVRVEETRRCVIAPEAGATALRLWQEAQSALAGAAVSTMNGTTSFVLSRFQRELELRTNRVIRETRWQTVARGSETYASVPADSLAAAGFVRKVGSDAIYFAPDARTLLSESFARTHCLRPVAGASGADSVGLGFEPIGRGARTDVSGTLWLARSTGKLKYLQFEYVDLAMRSGRRASSVAPATGHVDYKQLPNGAWIINSWVIRAPLIRVDARNTVALSAGRMGGVSTKQDTVSTVTGWWEFGGDVLDVTASTAERAGGSANGSKALRGTLIDSVTRNGISGVVASVQASDGEQNSSSTTTDALGSFAFDSLAPGDYVLHFSSRRLDTLGVVIPNTAFSVLAGRELRLTTLARLLGIGRACPNNKRDQRIIHGVIRDSVSGAPLRGRAITVSWLNGAEIYADGQGIAALTFESTIDTDSAGRYVICGAPRARPVTLQVAGSVPGSRKLQIPAATDSVVLRNIDLGTGGPAGRGAGSIYGAATDQSGSVIAAADVALLDNPEKRARTDSAGVFRLNGVPLGSHLIRVRRLGFVPSTVAVRIESPNGVAVHVVMAANQASLRPVDVRAPSGQTIQLSKVVAQRVLEGQGNYILAGDVRIRSSYSTSDVFRRIQGITVKGDVAVSTRGVNSLLADPCPLGIPLYVDGSLMGDNTLDVVAPSEIAAIEIYPSTATMPPSIGPSACGVIMIWTK